MHATQLLDDGFARVREETHDALRALPPGLAVARIDGEANTISWLAWHLARVQDAQVAALSGREEVWIAGRWSGRFDLPFDPRATGYGQSPAEVGMVDADPALILGYLDEVTEATHAVLAALDDEGLDAIIDARYDPPVTVGVRLVSILADDLAHLGQIGLLRGHLERTALTS
jgi:hypothetical protein